MKQLIKNTKIIWLFIMAISFIGCNDDDDVNLPKIVASFAHTINEDTGAVSFLNLSENADSYSWDFGDGTSSTEINPIRSFPTGTYTVVLTVDNAAGATGTFEDEIVINIPLPVNFPITFDDPNVNYNITTFNGVAFEIVNNPDASGSNTSTSKVGAITNSGAAFEGLSFDLGMALDLTTLKSVKVNFWSDTPIDILMKLEQGTGGDIETTVSHGGTGWEMITFNFASDASYSRITFFVDGPGTTAGTFYIDDIEQIETPPAPCTAESAQSLDAADFNLTFQTDPGASIGSFDAVLTTISNPDSDNAVNSSCQVGQIDRNGGALFANNQIEFDAKLDFNANAGFKMKVWSPVAGTNVLVKLEDKTNSGINIEVGATTTTASAWEELTFDFASGESGKYDKIILFFELNTNTTETYYIDDFMLYGTGGGGTACTPETMESLGGADLNLTFMSDPSASIIEDGGDFEWIDNPDFDNSVNSSCKVGQITKLGANPWDNNQIDLDAKLDFNANEGLKIKVWSARANTEVRIKLEEIGNSGNNNEQFLTTSVTSGWEELTFPYTSADSDKFNKIVIFFDLNASNTDTYYFDDLMLYGTGGGGTACVPPAGDLVSNGDFETGTDSCWNVFQNGGTAVLDNTISNGGTWSGKLATNGPSNPAFKQEGIGVGTVIAGDVVQITFDHIGSVVQPGAVFNVLLFGEGAAPGASFTHVFSPAPALTGSWTTFTGTFTIPAGTDVTGGISFLIEAVCGGDAGCSVSANIDNVSVTLNP